VHLGEGVVDTRHIEPESVAGAEIAVGKEYQVVIEEFGLLGTVFILQYAVSAKFLAWDAETEHLSGTALNMLSAALCEAGSNSLDAACLNGHVRSPHFDEFALEDRETLCIERIQQFVGRGALP